MVAPRKISSENSRDDVDAAWLVVTGASETEVDISYKVLNAVIEVPMVTYPFRLRSDSIKACLTKILGDLGAITVRERTLLFGAGHRTPPIPSGAATKPLIIQ